MNYYRKKIVVLQTLLVLSHQLAIAGIEYHVVPMYYPPGTSEGPTVQFWEVRIKDDGTPLAEHLKAWDWESVKG